MKPGSVCDAGIDLQAVQCGLHTEDVLADVEEGPGGGAGHLRLRVQLEQLLHPRSGPGYRR